MVGWQELQDRVAKAKAKDSSEEMLKIRKEIVDFHGEMVLLENYSALNYTGTFTLCSINITYGEKGYLSSRTKYMSVKAVNFSGSPIIVVHMLPFDSGFTNILQDNFSTQVLFFLRRVVSVCQ